MPRTVIIAQARMSSTRLPGKTLMDLAGRPVVDHVIERARRSELSDDLVIATTTDASDDILADHVIAAGVKCVRGSLDDVLSRYAVAAETVAAETIVRITCDCPLIDPTVIDSVIESSRCSPTVDYCSNTLVRTYPIGMDTEVFSAAALYRANAEASQQHEREHVTPYIYQHPESFRLRNVKAPDWATWPDLRLTVDTSEDLDLVQTIAGRAGSEVGLHDIIDLLRSHPEMVDLNRHVAHRHIEKPESW